MTGKLLTETTAVTAFGISPYPYIGDMASTTASSLATTIRRVRVRLGLTQAQFAKKIGVRQQKLSEWERGKRLRAVFDAMKLLKAIQR